MMVHSVENHGPYKLIARVSGEERTACFRGRRADGTNVLIHQFAPGFDHSETLRLALFYIFRVPPTEGGKLWDYYEVNGVLCMVTADETPCLSLREWLTWEAAKAPEIPGETRAIPIPAEVAEPTMKMKLPPDPPPAPSEFTRILRNPSRVDLTPLVPESPPAPIIAAPPPPVPQKLNWIPFVLSFFGVVVLLLIAVWLIRMSS